MTRRQSSGSALIVQIILIVIRLCCHVAVKEQCLNTHHAHFILFTQLGVIWIIPELLPVFRNNPEWFNPQYSLLTWGIPEYSRLNWNNP